MSRDLCPRFTVFRSTLAMFVESSRPPRAVSSPLPGARCRAEVDFFGGLASVRPPYHARLSRVSEVTGTMVVYSMLIKIHVPFLSVPGVGCKDED